jgi:hypothetical protein
MRMMGEVMSTQEFPQTRSRLRKDKKRALSGFGEWRKERALAL